MPFSYSPSHCQDPQMSELSTAEVLFGAREPCKCKLINPAHSFAVAHSDSESCIPVDWNNKGVHTVLHAEEIIQISCVCTKFQDAIASLPWDPGGGWLTKDVSFWCSMELCNTDNKRILSTFDSLIQTFAVCLGKVWADVAHEWASDPSRTPLRQDSKALGICPPPPMDFSRCSLHFAAFAPSLLQPALCGARAAGQHWW